MKKTIRTIEVSVIIGILLFSIFAAFIPSVSALIPSTPVLKLEPVNVEDLTPLVNIKQPVKIEIKVTYSVTGPFSSIVTSSFETQNVVAPIGLSVVDPGLGISASVEPNVLQPKIKASGETFDTAILSVTFTEYVIGKLDVPITIKMEAQKVSGFLFHIEGLTQTGTITIAPQYSPIIYVLPADTLYEVTPGEVLNIPIYLENLGNDKTRFILGVDDLPEGWVASINTDIVVDSAIAGGNNKETVMLSVMPPYNFGYHDETQVIKFHAKGQYYISQTGETLESDERVYEIQIRNRGFSTPGFEGVFVILALVGIAFIVKKRKKTK